MLKVAQEQVAVDQEGSLDVMALIGIDASELTLGAIDRYRSLLREIIPSKADSDLRRTVEELLVYLDFFSRPPLKNLFFKTILSIASATPPKEEARKALSEAGWPEGTGRVRSLMNQLLKSRGNVDIYKINSKINYFLFPFCNYGAGELHDVAHSYLKAKKVVTLTPHISKGRTSNEVRTLVSLGSYLGAAAIGGIVGNRADQSLVAIAVRMFRSVHYRWHLRRVDDSSREASDRQNRDALTKHEAVDAARAAAYILGYSPSEIRRYTAQLNNDDSWSVVLFARGEELRARVPSGDPAKATILITKAHRG